MYVCVCVCIYIYIYMCVCVCVCVCVYHKLQIIENCPTNIIGIMNEPMSKIAFSIRSEVTTLPQ